MVAGFAFVDLAAHSHWFYAFGSGFILCFVLSAAWHRALRKEVKRRLAIETQLHEQVEFQNALLESIPLAICVRDINARLSSCNAAFEHLFGVPRGQMKGKTVTEGDSSYAEARRLRGLHERYLQVLAGQGTISEDANVILDGEHRRLFHWAVPIILPEARAPIAMVAGVVDVTERHHLIEQLEAARAQAEAASRTKSNFLATVSHEIRTPMNAVMGMLELLVRESNMSAHDRESVDIARRSAASLLGLIDDILDISKIEANALEIVPGPACVLALVEDVVKAFAGLARQRGLALDIDANITPLQWHIVDAARFKQIANNLVSNAIKYTDTGKITVRVGSLGMVGEAESMTLEVEDTGIGIAPRDIDNLFRPFFQAEAAGPRTVGGTGLGLPIVRRLCQLMGGDIEVQSELGKGSCVRIRLPLRPYTPAEPRTAPPMGQEVSALEHAWPERVYRILVVDDHPVNRLLLQRQLTCLGLDCVLAEDGEVALAAWLQHPFDLVITDCSMPRMDGYALTSEIRKAERARALVRRPILGCTAHVREEDRRHALDVGMDECLMKPLSLGTLSHALRRHLSGITESKSQPGPMGAKVGQVAMEMNAVK